MTSRLTRQVVGVCQRLRGEALVRESEIEAMLVVVKPCYAREIYDLSSIHPQRFATLTVVRYTHTKIRSAEIT